MKRIALSFFLALAFLLGAIGILPQGKAQAGFEVRTPVVTGPVTINPHVTDVFTISGLPNGESVTLQIGGKTAGQGSASNSGVYTVATSAAKDLPYGDVAVTGGNDSYTATIIPGLTVSKGSGNVGSSVTVAGNGFAASESYTVTFVDAYTVTGTCIDASATVTDALVITGTATAWGSFSKIASVPDVADGTYYFVAKGITSATCAVSQ